MTVQRFELPPSNGASMQNADPEISVSAAIAQRRSVRSYVPGPLDKEAIHALLSAAIRAPTALHEEPWAFVIAQGKHYLKQLSAMVRAPSTDPREHLQAEESRQALDKYQNPEFNIFYDAETLIIICTKIPGAFVAADCWLAAENLMLTACAMRLGTCVIGSAVSGLNTRHVKAELGIPEEMLLVVPIIVGVQNAAIPAAVHKNAEPLILAWKGKPGSATA